MTQVRKTGFFCSRPAAASSTKGVDVLLGLGGWAHAHGREQRGVIRTNCLDCLDRSNAAASIIAQVALSYQMVAHGHYSCLQEQGGAGGRVEAGGGGGRVVERNLADMYAVMGDTLAQVLPVTCCYLPLDIFARCR